jgi:hypothetical protein
MKFLILASIAVAVVAIFTYFTLNPLRRSQESIESRLYRITPAGTSFQTATSKLSSVFGKISISDKCGFLRQDWPAATEVVGTKSIDVYLGEYYHFPVGQTDVTAYWGFDNNGKLIEIWVWKDTDSL